MTKAEICYWISKGWFIGKVVIQKEHKVNKSRSNLAGGKPGIILNSLDDLPKNLCEPSKKIIKNYKENKIYEGEC